MVDQTRKEAPGDEEESAGQIKVRPLSAHGAAFARRENRDTDTDMPTMHVWSVAAFAALEI